MPGSTLIYRERRGTAGAGRLPIMGLHSAGATSAQLMPLIDALGLSLWTVTLEAPLPISPYRQDGGQQWFLGDAPGSIEPDSFADSLYQVEQSMLELCGACRSQLLLMGAGQGGVLALTLACLWPEKFAGVIAIDGHLPVFAGWSPGEVALSGLPALLLHDQDGPAAIGRLVKVSARDLAQRGARVTEQQARDLDGPPAWLAGPIIDWLTEAGLTT